MLLLILNLCAYAVSAQQMYAIYQAYSAAGCTGNIINTAGYANNFCIVDGNDSLKYTCNNNIVTDSRYTGSTTCTGSPTSSNTFPPTCTG